jgi:hypothetical protein
VLKQLTIGAALLMLSMTVAIAESANPAAQLPDVHAGDKWVYQSTDDITGEKKFEITFVVTESNDKQIFVRATKSGGTGTQFMVYDRAWNLVSDDSWRKMPNDGTGIKLPLAVGQEWRSKNRVQNLKNGIMFNATTSSKIVAAEKLSTEAGTFDALKIVMEVERIPVADPSRHVEFTLTTWYAPAVHRMIKRTVVEKQSGHVRDSSTLELIQYSLK